MDPERRKLIKWSGAASALGALAQPAAAATAPASAPTSTFGLDAAQMGVRAGSPDDQSVPLQRAIDRAAQARVPLALPPGVYRAGGLRLPSGAALIGVRGATRLVFGGGPSLIAADHAETVVAHRPHPRRRAAAAAAQPGARPYRAGARRADCRLRDRRRPAGTASGSPASPARSPARRIADAADVALLSSDARGLTIAGNTIANAGNNGIVIIRSAAGHDGTMVLDNRIEDTRNRDGGSGQFGNAINAHRAGDVIVRGNLIRALRVFRRARQFGLGHPDRRQHRASMRARSRSIRSSASRARSSPHNVVDGAQTGVSVANFNEGGRLAIVQGNILRNLAPPEPQPAASCSASASMWKPIPR